jgi:hypothetical protein
MVRRPQVVEPVVGVHSRQPVRANATTAIAASSDWPRDLGLPVQLSVLRDFSHGTNASCGAVLVPRSRLRPHRQLCNASLCIAIASPKTSPTPGRGGQSGVLVKVTFETKASGEKLVVVYGLGGWEL